jgi:hypothetical protein
MATTRRAIAWDDFLILPAIVLPPISVPEKAWLFRAKKSAFRKFYPYDYSISRQAGQLTTA